MSKENGLSKASQTEQKKAWSDDKLSRQECADFLTAYLVKRFGTASGKMGQESFVLNVNSGWGLGKTYFLQNWKLDLEEAGFPIIYYDAWKNDFSDEPLLGFISELERSLESRFTRSTTATRKANLVVSSAKKLLRPTAPLLAAALAKKLTGMTLEELLDVADQEDTDSSSNSDDKGNETLSKAVEKVAETALKEHKTKQKCIAAFRRNMKSLITHIANNLTSVQLPIFVMVDELDRCRPTYAIELLENIKHIFGVPGICFVVATDSRQLAASVKAVYGNEFDAERYLQRFFDQEYVLPAPNYESFSQFLFSKNQIPADKTFNPFSFEQNANPNIELFARFSKGFGLTLRAQKQCYEMLRAIYLTWRGDQPMHIFYMLFLIFLRHSRKDAFDKYTKGSSGTSWQQALDNETLASIVLPSMQNIDPFNARPVSVSLLSAINEYSQLALRNRTDIVNNSHTNNMMYVQEINNRLMSVNSFSELNNPLIQYIKMVQQVGQLT